MKSLKVVDPSITLQKKLSFFIPVGKKNESPNGFYSVIKTVLQNILLVKVSQIKICVWIVLHFQEVAEKNITTYQKTLGQTTLASQY